MCFSTFNLFLFLAHLSTRVLVFAYGVIPLCFLSLLLSFIIHISNNNNDDDDDDDDSGNSNSKYSHTDLTVSQ